MRGRHPVRSCSSYIPRNDCSSATEVDIIFAVTLQSVPGKAPTEYGRWQSVFPSISGNTREIVSKSRDWSFRFQFRFQFRTHQGSSLMLTNAAGRTLRRDLEQDSLANRALLSTDLYYLSLAISNPESNDPNNNPNGGFTGWWRASLSGGVSRGRGFFSWEGMCL